MIENNNGIGSRLGRAGDWVCQDPWELPDRRLGGRCTGSEADGGNPGIDSRAGARGMLSATSIEMSKCALLKCRLFSLLE